MIEELKNFGPWLEISVLAVSFYFILNFIRGTRGAGILKGVAFLFIVAFLGTMWVTEVFGLYNIRTMLTWILSGSALAMIVIFAPELRRGLSRLAQSPLLSPLLREPSSLVVGEMVDAAVKLSKNRIGALVAIERDVGLGEYVENGVPIRAQLTSELLETVFYPGTALHDGAVIVRRDQVAAAACLLPLTDDPSLSKSLGTRHRAALGISEETDAIALVVSEETGRISVAAGGKLLSDLNRESLEGLLNDLFQGGQRPAGALRGLKGAAPESAAAAPAGGNGSAQPLHESGTGPVPGPQATPEDASASPTEERTP